MQSNSQQFAYLQPTADNSGASASQKTALRSSVRGPMLAGFLSVTLLVAGFGGWAATGLLASGAIAPGVISPDGSRKTIQHLEPGIINQILVRDGDYVEVGTALLTLEDTTARASYEMLLKQFHGLRGRQARLTAERLGHDKIEFPRDLLAAATHEVLLKQYQRIKGQQARLNVVQLGPTRISYTPPKEEPADGTGVSEILAVQQQIFAARAEALAARKRILEQRTKAIQEQMIGFEAQLLGAAQRVRIIDEELKGKRYLLERMLVPKPQVLALERTRTEIVASIGQYQAATAEAKQRISETEYQLVGLDTDRTDEITAELDKVREELAKVTEQIRASEDTLKRTVITAPVSGTVVNLRFKTRGGIIQSGEQILDIVPDKDELLIDARVAPMDIDVVHAGLRAQVHLSAFTNRRSLPRVDGVVRSVSADALRDEKTGNQYYLARVEVARDKITEALGVATRLVPGMPAEVLIVTGERTLLEYLLTPLRDVFRRGLKET